MKCSRRVRRAWFKLSRWLRSSVPYQNIPEDEWARRPRGTSRLRDGDLEKIKQARLAATVTAADGPPRGFVRTFPTPQAWKRRRRWINHTVSINDFCERLMLSLPNVTSVKSSLYHGSHSVCLDMQQWFHQFPISQEVSMRMCFEHKGEIFRLTRLPMGMRQSCAIAQAALEVLTDGLHAVNYIDNVKLTGTAEQCESDCAVFLERCAFVGATVNPDDRTPRPNVEFLGLKLDHEAKTVAIGDKTLAKLDLCREQLSTLPELTYGQVSSVMGTLFYTHWVYRGSPADTTLWHWRSLQLYCRLGKELQANPDLLDSTLHVSELDKLDMFAWLKESSGIGPFHVPHVPDLPTYMLITDASKSRWKAFLVDMQTGSITDAQGAFEVEQPSSVSAEPIAMLNGFRALVPQSINCRVICVTDHQSMLSSIEKGYSVNPKYNKLLQAARRHNAGARLEGCFLPGIYNPADESTRGLPTDKEKLDHAIRFVIQCHTDNPKVAPIVLRQPVALNGFEPEASVVLSQN